LLHQAVLVGAQGVELGHLSGDPGIEGGEAVSDAVLLFLLNRDGELKR